MTDQATITTSAEEDDRNIIKIPADRIDILNAEMEKINRKATKLGCPKLSYEILKEFTIKDPRDTDPDNMRAMYGLPTPTIRMIEVEIKGEGPKIEGWTFLGTFDHVTLPGSVIVNTVPGETIPKQFHNCEPICDHCGKIRRRNETFLMREDDTGTFKLVGRQCVRDFIGYDAKQIFQFLTAIRKLREKFDEDEFWGGNGGQWNDMFPLDAVLAWTAAIIHKEGWVSKSKAGWDQIPTSQQVVTTCYPPSSSFDGGRALRLWKAWVESLDLGNEKWKEEARAARAWLKEQPDNNEYMHNLHTIDQNPLGEIPTKLFGYWCSLVSSYQRAMETLREQAKKKRVNEHVGAIKERRDFKVTLDKIRTFEGGWGYVYLHHFLDDAGHTLVWFASSEQDYKYDEEYTIKATVKKHDEYKGWAQTVVSRVVEVK